MNTRILEIKNLQKKFGNFNALTNISFNVYEGDIFGFLGPNGSGKSTTIRCILSLIKQDAGLINIFGKKIKENRKEILSKIGCIIEKPDFYKYMSAKKNLEIFSRISGISVSKNKIYEMLEFVGLSSREKDKVKGFSHGMKQRLGIAYTLLHNPDLIILDEPTTGLDPQGIVEIRNLILRLNKEENKTILLSSHQLSEIELIANRMVIINKGEKIIEGNVSELLNNEEILVEFNVNDINSSMEILKNHYDKMIIRKTGSNQIEVVTNSQSITKINNLFVMNDINVKSIIPKRKLEDYYMKIINQ